MRGPLYWFGPHGVRAESLMGVHTQRGLKDTLSKISMLSLQGSLLWHESSLPVVISHHVGQSTH